MKTKTSTYPYLIWSTTFVVIPLILIIFYSLTTTTESGNLTFTLSNFKRAFEPIYLKVIWRSIYIAIISTIFCFILGYPLAYLLASKEYRGKNTLLFLFIVPMWLNMLLRTYSWLTILERNGIINNILVSLGFSRINFLYTDFAVTLGMVYNFLPFMILPIYTVLSKIDDNIIEAAQDLGANNKEVFRKIIFPISVPGIISGITMVFMPALTSFVVPNLLGGSQYMLAGSLIEQQFLRVGNWNFGSALSVVILIIMIVTMAIFNAFDKDSNNIGGGLF